MVVAMLVGAEEIIEECRAGRMFILVDDEDRENEGDLVLAGQFATTESINFMARYARGLICLALTRKRADQLRLAPMHRSNDARHDTAFTLSIEAREGVTTGISAADRAMTISAAVNPEFDHTAIVTPGHVFPLIAREGGTLVRAGHTEAAVDISRLAGLNPSGVICEIMNEDGTMARLPELKVFAREHNMKIGTIADLIAYRRRTETLVERVTEASIRRGADGDWEMFVYRDKIHGAEHLAMVKGDISGPEPVIVRVHAPDMIGELLLPRKMPMMRSSMRMIAEKGRGIVVCLGGTQPAPLSTRINQLKEGVDGETIVTDGSTLKDYGIGAQILKDQNVTEMVLLTNRPQHIIGLEAYGLSVTEIRPVKDFD